MTARRRAKLGTVAVDGPSMLPTYGPGDWLVVWWGAPVRVGSVVVAARADGTQVIKRVIRSHEGQWWLEGDNSSASTDSRQIGPFDVTHIKGRVLFRYRRGNTAGS